MYYIFLTIPTKYPQILEIEIEAFYTIAFMKSNNHFCRICRLFNQKTFSY